MVDDAAVLRALDLPRRQRRLLDHLFDKHGVFVSKSALVTEIWADDIDGGPLGAENVCEHLVHRVRRAIAGTGWQITTRRNLGYRLERAPA
jgi:DNA-binding response OmpR family regulator